MKLDHKKINLLFISLYLIGMVVSAFFIFNLKNELIYDLQVLDISDSDKSDQAFYKLYTVVGLSLLLGLIALYYSMKSEDVNVIYVEKSKEEVEQEQQKEEAQSKREDKLNKEELSKLFSRKNADKGKNLDNLLSTICKSLEASQGAIYFKEISEGKRLLKLQSAYAMSIAESEEIAFEFGEGLIGQVAKEEKTMYIDDVPEGLVTIISGLGSSSPSHLLVVPAFSGGKLTGVAEFATFVPVRKNDIATLEELFKNFGTPSEEQEIAELVDVEADASDDEIKTKKLRKK